MSIVTQERPAAVPGRKRAATRAVEIRIVHKHDGAWEIERESESRPGLYHLIHVREGVASHDDGPSFPPLACPAREHGRGCAHLAQAAALVACGEIVTEALYDIAACVHAGEWTPGPEGTREYVAGRRQRIADAVAIVEARCPVRITKVIEEGLL